GSWLLLVHFLHFQLLYFFFSSRRRHTSFSRDWSSDVCSSDLGGLVDALSSALDSGGHGLSNVPVLLKRLLAEEWWREFETVRGEVVRHERFEEFVAAPPLKGLGSEISLIKRIVADDREAVDLLDR